jgi:hypothetical protein
MRVIERPRWAAIMLFTLLITGACGAALMATAVGRQALVDQWERTALAFGREVDEHRYAEFVAMSERGPEYAALSALVAGPVLTCAIAGAILAVFNGALGGAAAYEQVLAIVAHAGVILALRQVVATPFNYSGETLASPTTFGHLLPIFDEASLPARFLGAIDLFVVWWVIVLAIGVALLYRRSAPSIALAFIGAYVGFAALLAIAMVLSGGTV